MRQLPIEVEATTLLAHGSVELLYDGLVDDLPWHIGGTVVEVR